MHEILPVWSSKSGTDGLKFWASKPSGRWFVGLSLITREWFGGFGLKTFSDGFDRFGPQNQRVAKGQICDKISKLASLWSRVKKTSGSLDLFGKNLDGLALEGYLDECFMWGQLRKWRSLVVESGDHAFGLHSLCGWVALRLSFSPS